MANYDVLGNLMVVKFGDEVKTGEKKKIAEKLLKEHKSVRTVVEKVDRFKGRLRTIKTRYLAGEKTKEVLYKENGCEFRFNVESCYFSPRLAGEREEIANKVKKGERVLVMFSGVGVYGIVIAKKKKAEVTCVELSRACNKYALENVKRNKVSVEIVQGDVRRVVGKGKKISGKFDRIVMARPNLKDSFLDVAFKVSKRGTEVNYYGFYSVEDAEEKGMLKKLILEEAKKAKKKVKILRMKRAGDIAPYKFRYRIDLKVLN